MQPPQSPLNAKQCDCIGLHCRMSLGRFAMHNSRAAPWLPRGSLSAESESESFACVGFAAVLFVSAAARLRSRSRLPLRCLSDVVTIDLGSLPSGPNCARAVRQCCFCFRYRLDVVSCGKNWNKIRKSVTAGFFTHAAKKDPQVSKSAQCSARRRIAALRCAALS